MKTFAVLAILILAGALTSVGVAQTTPSTGGTAAVEDNVARQGNLRAANLITKEANVRLSEDKKLHDRIDGISAPNLSGYAAVKYVRDNYATIPRTQIWKIYTILGLLNEVDAKKRVYEIESELKKELAEMLKKPVKTVFEMELRERVLVDAFQLKFKNLSAEIESLKTQTKNVATKDDLTKVQTAVAELSETVDTISRAIALRNGRSEYLDADWERLVQTDARLDGNEFVKSSDLSDMKLVDEDGAREIAEEIAVEEVEILRNEFGPHLLKLSQAVQAMGAGLQSTTAKASQRPVLGFFGKDPKVMVKPGNEVSDSISLAREIEDALAEFAANPESTTDGE